MSKPLVTDELCAAVAPGQAASDGSPSPARADNFHHRDSAAVDVMGDDRVDLASAHVFLWLLHTRPLEVFVGVAGVLMDGGTT